MGQQDKNASRALIAFVRSFTDLQEKHLKGIHQTMRETVEGVMQGIHDISEKTATNKKKANEVLVTTYTNPDDAAKQAMNDVQDEVDKVLNAATASMDGTDAGDAPAMDELAGKVRRTAGTFSKHMEALETLDGEVAELLLAMMGQLSRDDVISQRIEHVMMALQAMQTSLTYLLTDYETRSKDGEVERFVADLKSYSFRTYTMEEEKTAFYEVFPEERQNKKKKAS